MLFQNLEPKHDDVITLVQHQTSINKLLPLTTIQAYTGTSSQRFQNQLVEESKIGRVQLGLVCRL